MAYEKVVKLPKPASEDFLPWKLIPMDLESTSNGGTRTERASSLPMPIRPISHLPAHPPIPDGIPSELSDTTFIELRSVLSKICRDDNMQLLVEEDISNQLVPLSPIRKSTSSENSESIIENAGVDQLVTSVEDFGKAAKYTPVPEYESKPSSLIRNEVEKQAEKSFEKSTNASKIDDEDKTLKFIDLVRGFPQLHTTENSSEKVMKRKEKSWRVIGEVLGMTVNDCIKTWNKLRAKNKRKRKRLADGEDLSEKTMRFLNTMNFLSSKEESSVKRKNISEDYTLPVSVPKKRKTTGSRSSPSIQVKMKPTDSVSYNCIPEIQTFMEKETRTNNESPNPDQLFTDNIAIELKRMPPHLKNLIKAKIWQVVAEFAHPV